MNEKKKGGDYMKDLLTTIRLQEERKRLVEEAYASWQISKITKQQNIAEADAIIQGAYAKIAALENKIS